MHRLFVPPERIGETVRLSPEQSRHLETVLRLQPGAEVEVFDGGGARWSARIESVGVLRLGPRMEAHRGATDVWLAQGLAKGEKLDLVVQKATELGATRILPLATDRSVVRLDTQRAERRAQRFRRIAQEAARQSGRSDVPRVDAPRTVPDLAALLEAEPDRRGVLLHPEEREVRLSQAVRGSAKLLLAIGPEGGFTDDERAAAVAAGFVPATLGRLVLRTETAGLAALAVVQHVAGELG
ncbi:MAG TPA: 16S rRNA (uracil(1498)-N(3))-methyltransferase [Myxococcales bacterium]|nr:16S rRNA (uracil(1498)-N(3))-methyltransferase [Myxococcales bacterium]